MNEKDKIKRGLPSKRDATCYRVERDIVIPAGTILRDAGDNHFSAPVGSAIAEFIIYAKPGENLPPEFKRVIA